MHPVKNTHQEMFVISLISVMIVYLLSSSVYAQPLAEGHDKFLGNIVGYSGAPDNFLDYWNQVTPENSGKWGSAEPSRDNPSWGSLDNMMQFALDNEIPFRYHCLVWGQQQPSWISSLSEAEQREEVEEYIQAVAYRYPETNFVDVVNEPLHAPPPYKDAIGGDGETGWDWVIWSFEKARNSFPETTELHLNDYGILGNSSATRNYLVIINLLRDRGLIDGIGVQGHFLESTSASTIQANLDRLAETGLPIYVTEYDVNLADDQDQLEVYQEQFPVLWEHPNVRGITLWGYIEGQIWRAEAWLVSTEGVERPALQWLRNYLSGDMDVKEFQSYPTGFRLEQNYPNPFNPVTRIPFELDQAGEIQIEIINAAGQSIQTLANGSFPEGVHTVTWNGRDSSGNHAPSGVYFYQLQSRNAKSVQKQTRKMVLLQ
jgi:endo-1,4-beta-xylanase